MKNFRIGYISVSVLIALVTLSALIFTSVMATWSAQDGTTITVDATVDDTDVNGNCTLREAVIAANTDLSVDNCPAGSGADLIIVPTGIYILSLSGPPDDNAQAGDLDITSDLMIEGTGQLTTIIDANKNFRVFQVLDAGNVGFSKMTIRDGGGGEGGGGIWIGGASSSVTVTNSVLTNHSDGAIEIFESKFVMVDSIVSDSSRGSGGGIFNQLGSVVLSHSEVYRNVAQQGAGIYNKRGQLTLNNSTVYSNTSLNRGGGIYNTDIGAVVTLNNSTVSGNYADSQGGAIYMISDAELVLNNSTVTNNSADTNAGGFYIAGIESVTLQNSILAGNDAPVNPECRTIDPLNSLGFNLLGHTITDGGDCKVAFTTGDLISLDPRLGPIVGSPGYHPLLDGSPAIDRGNPLGCSGSTGALDYDQRGYLRFGRCDIGSYESQATKEVDSLYVLPGSPLAYSVVYQNGAMVSTTFTLTDTLPISVTYIENSLWSSSGDFGVSTGTITGTGDLASGDLITLTFGVTVNQSAPLSSAIVNSVMIYGAGETITRSAITKISIPIFLPTIVKQ